MNFLKNRYAMILTVILAAQAAGAYVVNSRHEQIPQIKPLNTLSHVLGPWSLQKEYTIEAEVQDVLKADDTLSRLYTSSSPRSGVDLFVAFFKSQRSGVAPHSPKNCLPGAGWVEERSEILHFDVPGRAKPLEVNHYVVQRGDNKNAVLYWYQSRERSVASEYNAKMYVIADAIRYNRSDTALIRVIVPFEGNNADHATEIAKNFVRTSYGPLMSILPQ
jgi:EpsI family protein